MNRAPPYFDMDTKTYYLREGGSGRGVSFYGSIRKGCLRRARITDALVSESETSAPPLVNISGGRGVGTLGHAFLDAYTNGYQGPLSDIQFVSVSRSGEQGPCLIDPKARTEAIKICDWWRETFPHDFLGRKIHDQEYHFEAVNSPLFGVQRFTADFDYTANLEKIPSGYEDQLSLTGIVVRDWKFISTKDQMTAYANSPQGLAYRMAAHSLGYAGFGYVFILKPEKKADQPTVQFHDLPNIDLEGDNESVRAWLQGSESRWLDTPTGEDFDLDECVKYNYMTRSLELCPFVHGRCTRKP